MRTLRRRYSTNTASTLLALGLCAACGSAGNGDYIELFPPDGGASGASGASGAGGNGGSGNAGDDDAGMGGAGGSQHSPDGGVEPGLACQVAFVSPAPGGGALHLGIDDDVDGAACGTSFGTRVRVASNAAHVALWVNDTTHSGLSQDVEHLSALFPNVQLSNAGTTPNVLKAVATMPDGRTCEAVLDTEVLVDCDMPSCTIVNPSGTQYLNAFEDSSSAGGFQVDFEVGTELENAGQPVRLTLDGASNQRLSAEVQDQAGDGVATFADVPLQEGRRLAQAECRDAAGNVAYSSLAEWIVDVTPCTVDLDLLPNPITTVHDESQGSPGLQIEVTGTVSGDGDCAEVLVGPCGAETFGTTTLGSGGEFSVLATLPAQDDPALELCAKVSDQAGNIGESTPQTKRVRVTPPAVAITSPASPSTFNHASDLNGSTPGCEVAFSVSCSDDGVNVELRQGNTGLSTASCDDGVATFAEVVLASRNNGSTTNITARQIADGLTGESAPVEIQPDCQAPQLSFAPAVHCGGQLSLTGHDVDGSTSGLQYNVTVFNDGVPGVALGLALGGGGAVQQVASGSTGSATFFNPVSFGATETSAVLNACATDPQGNQGCAGPCTIDIVDMPVVTITSPTSGDTLTSADDCDLVSSGLQVNVHGMVDAVDGSDVDISVGSSVSNDATTVLNGEFDACVNAAQDGLALPLGVSVLDDARPSFPASASISINIDGNAPSATIDAPVAVLQERRPGIVRMSWPAVTDEGGGPLIAYQMRCGPEPIDASNWAAATPVAIPLTPKTSGTEQIDLDAFRVGTTVHCAVRGEDIAHNLTDLPPSASTAVSVPFEIQEYTSILSSDLAFMASVTPVGDVNDDGFADMIYGVEDVGAQIIFGGAALDTTPDVTIDGLTGKFASVVTGLGDINDDGRPDFAISAATLNGTRGSVFIFFGKESGDAWPASISVSEDPCTGADLCIRGTEPNAGLGWDMAATDFDGDTIPDLVLGARAASGGGRVYVIRGGSQLAASGAPIDLPNAQPANDLAGFVIDAPQGTTDFGISVAAIGGALDGLGDLVIGANGVSGPEDGAVAFIPGQPYSGTGLIAPTTAAAVFATGNSAEFGVPVRGLGDFDGDGSGDVAVSIFNGTGTCEVFTRSAGNAGFSGSHLTFTNSLGNLVNWSTYMGNDLHPELGLIGDLDDDDKGELLLGAFGSTATVELFYGDTGAVGRDRLAADFGFAGGLGDLNPSFVGDLNGDGWNDVAIIEFNPFGDAVTTKITLLY